MSLRGFHIVFVTLCTLLFGFLAAWGFLVTQEHSPMVTTLSYIGLAGLLGMPFYGVYFYRKAKKFAL